MIVTRHVTCSPVMGDVFSCNVSSVTEHPNLSLLCSPPPSLLFPGSLSVSPLKGNCHNDRIKPCIAGIQGPYIQTVSGVYIYSVRGIHYSIKPCIAGIQGP